MIVNLLNKLTNFYFIINFLFIYITLLLFSNLNFGLIIFEMRVSDVSLNLKFDIEILKFILVIYIISFRVKKFSYIYIIDDLIFFRFFKLVLFFVISILILIISDSILLIVIGWDGLGLSRFLLVIYYNSWKSIRGSIVTLIINRFGDAIIIISLTFILGVRIGDLRVQIFLTRNYEFLRILLVLSLFTKRAQVPFIIWLPEAIEAPTPVSALVHSSTLVTAGIYLIINVFDRLRRLRYNYLYLTLGIWTIIIGGITGVILKDRKKVVALSTLSQLGFIVISISLGFEEVAYFHVLCHAVFKALLFIIVGLEINFKSHEQNFKPTNNKHFINLIIILKLISLLSLNAFPFFSGYYSKDLIFQINILTEKYEFVLIIIYGISLTVLYSLKLWFNKRVINFSFLNYNKFLLRSWFFLYLLGIARVLLGNIILEDWRVQIFSWEHWIIYIRFFFSYFIYQEKNILLKFKIDVLRTRIFLMKILPKIFYPSFFISYNIVKVIESSINEKLYIEIKYIITTKFINKVLVLIKINYFYIRVIKWFIIILLISFVF